MSRLIYCTAVPASGLPRALALGESLRRLSPGADFRILVLEHPRVARLLRSRLRGETLLGPDELDFRGWLHLAFMARLHEAPAAFQPALMRHLLPEGSVVYCDADVDVFAPLDAFRDGLRDADAVLMATSAPGAASPFEGVAELRQGPINLAAMAVASRPAGAALLDAMVAWTAEPDRELEAPAARHRFLGGTARFAAELLDSPARVHLLHPPRHGLAAWNSFAAAARVELDAAGGPPLTEQGPLVLCHYAGVRGAGAAFSRHAPGGALPPGSPLARLARAHGERLARSPQRGLAGEAWSLGTYSDGTPIGDRHRWAFRRLAGINRKQIVDPFASRWVIEGLSPDGASLASPSRRLAVAVGSAVVRSPALRAELQRALNQASRRWQQLRRSLTSP